jgi:dihydrofolate synthase/folylpolyglutamate synthase
MPSFVEALHRLQALGLELAPAPDGTRRKWDLAHMRALAQALGDPQRRFRSVLIAGTNGKGSTAATLQSILTAAGYRTGLYTSPHLERVTERIRIGDEEIPEADFARLHALVAAAAETLVAEGRLPQPPSFFETLTALAFLHFAERRVDLAILEVGLGGRLDATNIVDPLVSVLTDIALDHQEYLGDTIAAITREKCGILRDNGTLITLPQHPEANQAIGEAAAQLHLRALSAAAFIPHTASRGYADPAAEPLRRNQYQLTLEGEPLTVDSPLAGRHQQRNLALAIAAAAELRAHHGFNLPAAAIAEGIRQTVWPGRLERLPGTPPLVLDVAHNPAGAWTLRAAIAELPEAQPRTLIFSCLADKPLEEMARILFPLFDASPDGDPARRQDHLILTQIDSPRATPLADLAAQAHALGVPAHAAPHPAAALAQARAVPRPTASSSPPAPSTSSEP